MAYKIMIDAGHGGYDGGASYNGRLEKDDTLALALAVGYILSDMGYDVEYTRTSDVYDSPVQKARIGNASGADLFVSIHRNSSPTPNGYNGVQTLVYTDSGIRADLARSVNSKLEAVGYRNVNVVERPNLAVLRRTSMPAILIEAGFINNDKDNDLFDTKFDDTAMAIARGIDEVLRASGVADGLSSTVVPVFSASNSNKEEEQSGSDLSDEVDGREVKRDKDDKKSSDASDRAETYYMAADDKRRDAYQLLVGIFRGVGSANYMMNSLINAGFEAMIYEDEGLYQVRVGVYDDIEDALVAARELRDRGYDPLVVR